MTPSTKQIAVSLAERRLDLVAELDRLTEPPTEAPVSLSGSG